MITDCKLLVAVFKKDVESLSHCLQRILLWIHQYNIRTLYKPGPKLSIREWLSRYKQYTNRDEDIPGMHITINAIGSCTDIPYCTTAEEIREMTIEDEHFSTLVESILHNWPSTKTEV